jgi:hypothetical protein
MKASLIRSNIVAIVGTMALIWTAATLFYAAKFAVDFYNYSMEWNFWGGANALGALGIALGIVVVLDWMGWLIVRGNYSKPSVRDLELEEMEMNELETS